MREKAISHKFFKGLQSPEIMAIRTEVFVIEQGFVDEFDEFDKVSTHIVVYEDDKPIATGRYYYEEGKAHLGRIAVRKEWREKGIGRYLIERLEERILSEGHDYIYLFSQYDKTAFYEKCGYLKEDDKVYLDQDYPHYKLFKKIKQ